MDTLSKKEEDIIKKWMDETGLESPSTSFTDRVMQAVGEKKTSKTIYKPLIGKKGWWMVAALFVLSIGWLYFFPMGDVSYFNEIAVKSPEIKNPFENLKVSKTALYSIGFLALFLLQLPLLKSLINKQYSQ